MIIEHLFKNVNMKNGHYAAYVKILFGSNETSTFPDTLCMKTGAMSPNPFTTNHATPNVKFCGTITKKRRHFPKMTLTLLPSCYQILIR